MKMILAIFLACSLSPMARADADKDTGFDKHKTEWLSSIDEHIGLLQQEKSCVTSARSHEDMKHCHEQVEKKEKELRIHRLEAQKQHIDDEIKRARDDDKK